MLDEREIDLWIENDLNVLFEGRHGVGKTAVITAAFDRHNLNWKYFSAATMDPWVDFVGIPKDGIDEEGRPVLDLIRPRGFHDDTVEAIFMDELNRAPKKVRNAVMELIQFKSINGVPFPNLRFIWAAINPDDVDSDISYDVERLDDAQKDRFHICIDIPYKPDSKYFKSKYGTAGEGALEWWAALTEDQKAKVSPRRLDYALKIHAMGGSVRHVLKDRNLNATKLIELIDVGSIKKKLSQLMKGTEAERVEAFANTNFVTNALPRIFSSPQQIAAFAAYVPRDMLADEILKKKKSAREIVEHAPASVVAPILESIAVSETLTKRQMKTFSKFIKHDLYQYLPEGTPGRKPSPGTFTELLIDYYKKTNTCNQNSTNQRINALEHVFAVIDSQLDGKDEVMLISCLMFLAAIIARTQQATLNRSGHSIPALVQCVLDAWQVKSREGNFYLVDTWKTVKKELQSHGAQKKYVSGHGKGKVFSIKEIDKIEAFINI